MLCHYDTQKIVRVDDETAARRKAVKAIRYALYRWRTEARVDALIEQQKAAKEKPRKPNKMEPEHAKTVAKYAKQLVVIHNGVPLGFAEKWDVDPMDPSKVYVRGEGVQKQWDDEARAAAKELPGAE